eukprot:Awhi_evm1s4542
MQFSKVFLAAAMVATVGFFQGAEAHNGVVHCSGSRGDIPVTEWIDNRCRLDLGNQQYCIVLREDGRAQRNCASCNSRNCQQAERILRERNGDDESEDEQEPEDEDEQEDNDNDMGGCLETRSGRRFSGRTTDTYRDVKLSTCQKRCRSKNCSHYNYNSGARQCELIRSNGSQESRSGYRGYTRSCAN